MALVISMRVGQDFYIADQRVVVSWIESPYKFGLKLGGELHIVNDLDWTTIYPGVRVMAGTPRNQYQNTIVKVMVEAPGMTVLRGQLYRGPGGEKPKVEECKTCLGTKKLKNKLPCPDCGGHGCKGCSYSGSVLEEFQCPDCGEEHATE